MMRHLMGLLCVVGVAGSLGAADIAYVADGSSGEYCGTGYGISVSVSSPASGYTVEYAASEDGPWSATPVAYTDVCADRPVWFRIAAAGYETVVDSRDVTVTPKDVGGLVWPVLPAGGYFYDGTAKTPEVGFGDGEPSILTRDDFDVSYEDNVEAGTAKMVFTGKGNYAGRDEQEFDVAPAENAWTTQPAVADWTYGQTPSEPVSAAKSGTASVAWSTGAKPTLPGSYTATFTVPASRNYRELTATAPFRILPATVRYAADGSSGEYCGAGHGVSVSVSSPVSGYSIEYAESADGPWSATPVAYTNACAARPVWFRIAAAGYETVVDSRDVTVTPKPLTSDLVWLVLPADGYVRDGTAKTPEAAFGDGEPSIMSREDFTVSYTNNVEAGTATAVFTGRNNYAGTVAEDFAIRAPAPVAALLSADVSWKYLKATGTWFAQVGVICTDGLAAGIENLRFEFADRVDGGATNACLWSTRARAAHPGVEVRGGAVWRRVPLDASRIVAEGGRVVYGVSDPAAASVPEAERGIELYVRRRVGPADANAAAAGVDDFVGYVVWESGGRTNAVPVAAGADASDALARAAGLRGAGGASPLPAPLPAERLNASLAVGAALADGSSPQCRLASFAVDGGAVRGTVETGAVGADGTFRKGSPGANASVVLLGAPSPAGPWREVGTPALDADGAFEVPAPADAAFFRVRIGVGGAVR